MVALQAETEIRSDVPCVELGARLLAAAIEFEALLSMGATRSQAVGALLKDSAKYGRKLIECLSTFDTTGSTSSDVIVPVNRLQVGMVINEDVRNADGNLIVGKGHQVTLGSLQRLRNYAELGQLDSGQLRVCGQARSATDGISAVA
jgi:hypothetical protein